MDTPGDARPPVPDRAAEHGHAGREQEAREKGEHGWGYGGRQDQALYGAEPADAAEAVDAADAVDEADAVDAAEPTIPVDSGADDVAPRDFHGHHPDWRR